MPVQAQQGFQSRDQRPPLPALGAGAVAKGRGRDDGEPAGDLAAAHTGEQALRLDIDAGIDECRGQPNVIFSLVDAWLVDLHRCFVASVVDACVSRVR